MSETIENLLNEERNFPPPKEFAAQATAREGIHEQAAADRLAFWESEARRLHWRKEWKQVHKPQGMQRDAPGINPNRWEN